MTVQEFKRTARNPWKYVLGKQPGNGSTEEVVVLDWTFTVVCENVLKN